MQQQYMYRDILARLFILTSYIEHRELGLTGLKSRFLFEKKKKRSNLSAHE